MCLGPQKVHNKYYIDFKKNLVGLLLSTKLSSKLFPCHTKLSMIWAQTSFPVASTAAFIHVACNFITLNTA